ncbi:AzlD family protein [Haloplanus rubicundus]|uniref:AzlD domain-containing protein n=1 Tax=Haloplanus rubicundus TaxID=1547898 RepID=A0A345E8Y7_9EURY|nr:AzlD domain-containing protein [Haloplanus rubicundus]AXG08659.1 AzlD domain-containing protein [Haloplanus rubicundus]
MTDPFALAPRTVGVVLAMAAVTYLTKAGGLWALGHVDLPDDAETALDALPGAVVVSILAPAVATAGPPTWVAAGVVVVAVRRTGNVLVALLLGVGAVVLVRGAL